MLALQRGTPSSTIAPVLLFYAISSSSIIQDLYELSFQIFDISDAAKRAAPVQVYPSSAGTK